MEHTSKGMEPVLHMYGDRSFVLQFTDTHVYAYELLSNQKPQKVAIKEVFDFTDGLAVGHNEPSHFFVTEQGEYSDTGWVSYHGTGDWQRIFNDEKQNFINKKGWLLTTEWFDEVSRLDEEDEEDEVGYFSSGWEKVRKGTKWNLINTKGKFISTEWFDGVGDFIDGWAKVRKGTKKYNFINAEGKYIKPKWFVWASDFNDGWAEVRKGTKKYNLINAEGKYINSKGFDRLGERVEKVLTFHNGWLRVSKGNIGYETINLINEQGELLKSKWFDSIISRTPTHVVVQYANGSVCIIDLETRISTPMPRIDA